MNLKPWLQADVPSGDHIECVKAILVHVMLVFVAGLMCWELAQVNTISWISKSPHVIFQLFSVLDSVIVGYSIKVMDWPKKPNGRRALVQSRMKSRFGAFISVQVILAKQLLLRTWASARGTDCLIVLGWRLSGWQSHHKTVFVSKTVILVGDKGD